MDSIGDIDYIFISHLHPDHYDEKFLKKYFQKFGIKPIIIAAHNPNYLLKKMRADGFSPLVLGETITIGNTTVEIIPHKTGSASDIDSAIIVKYRGDDRTHCVVNVNDIVFDHQMIALIKEKAADIDILLCGYTGAGPYPQTYFNLDDPQLIVEGINKKNSFFQRYKTLINALDAKINIPFAGQYILGGKLSKLNSVRGVADSVEVLNFDPRAVVLGDNGGEINSLLLVPSKTRTNAYNERATIQVISSVADKLMDYERLISFDEIHQLPIKRLLYLATVNAVSKSELAEDYFFCFQLLKNEYAIVNANKLLPPSVRYVLNKEQFPTPRSEIIIDIRYLFGLITHIYHWNNAEVGSQFYTTRVPNIFNRKAQNFLNFFTI